MNIQHNNDHPDDKKNLILFLVLAVSLFLIHDIFILEPAREQARIATKAQKLEQEVQVVENKQPIISQQIAKAGRVEFDNTKIHGQINLQGALIDRLTLSDYNQTIDDNTPVELLRDKSQKGAYYATGGWVSAGSNGVQTPDANTIWHTNRKTLHMDAPVTLSWTNAQNIRFEQIISLDKDYMFTLNQRVINNSGQNITLRPYGLISRSGKPDDLQNIFIMHEGPIGYIDSELHENDYDDLAKNRLVRHNGVGGWIGITDKYWLSAIVPAQDQPVDWRFINPDGHKNGRYQVDAMGPVITVPAGRSDSYTQHIFAGAKELGVLEGYEKSLNIPHFDLAVDFGWLYFITRPFRSFLTWLNDYIGNFGITILVFTVFIRLAVFPLANKSYRSFAKLRMVSPEMMRLKEQYKDDKPGMQQALIKLYQKEQVNPMSGFLPIIIQVFIFFALYKVLYVSIEMRHAPFFGWLRDLSAPDPTSIFNLFGVLPFGVPSLLMVGVLPCLMGLSMLIQQRLNPPPTDPIQAKVIGMLPIVFTFILAGFPAGLVLYWTWSNTLGIVQQYVIMRTMGVKVNIFKRTRDDEKMYEKFGKSKDDIEEALNKRKASLGAAVEMESRELSGELEKPKKISPPKRKKKR